MINIRYLYNFKTRNGFFSTMSKKGKSKVSNEKGELKQPVRIALINFVHEIYSNQPFLGLQHSNKFR